MIKIQVVDYNALPPSLPLSAEFDEQGGNIGRAAGSTLILQNFARHIARLQASQSSIAFRDEKFFICSLGRVSIYFNEHPQDSWCGDRD